MSCGPSMVGNLISAGPARASRANCLCEFCQVASAEVSAAAAAALLRVAASGNPASNFSTRYLAPGAVTGKQSTAVGPAAEGSTFGVAGATGMEPRLLSLSQTAAWLAKPSAWCVEARIKSWASAL